MPYFWKFDASRLDDTALILSDGAKISYGELQRNAQYWKSKILSLSDGEPCFVVLEFETSSDAIAAYLGALDSGLALVVVEPGQAGPETSLRQIYAPEIIINRKPGHNAFEACRLDRIEGSGGSPQIAAHPDLRLLLSTSGSTGDPKLVRLSSQNIDSNARAIVEYLGILPSDKAMLTLPLFYSYGLSVLNSYLSAGGALVLNELSILDPEFWPMFRNTGATSLALVPHQFDLLEQTGFLEKANALSPKLKYITQAGGRLDPETARRFAIAGKSCNWDLVIMYGQTEAAPRISWVPPSELPDAVDTIGRAIPGGHIWLVDDEGTIITDPLIMGELVYEGPNVMMGYAESRADFARASETSALWTGDLAEQTEAGMFRIVGRKKRFVKLFGLRVNLDQIEALLSEKGIRIEAVAVRDILVLLYHEPDRGDEARHIVAERYKLRSSIILGAPLKQLPLLPSGKTDRPALQKIAEKVTEDQLSYALETKEASLAEILRQATRSCQVGPKDSFTSLGGDSLSYLQVQMALEERLGKVPDGWELLTLAQLNGLKPEATLKLGWSQVSIDVLLRLFAICLVVAQHASDFPLYGGTWILVLLIGYSAARFQSQAIENGHFKKLARNMLYPLIPLYFLIILTYWGLRDQVPFELFMLLQNYYTWPDTGNLLTPYWFVSLYAQIVGLLVLVSWSPETRRILKFNTFLAPLTLAMIVQAFLTLSIISGYYLSGREALWPVPHLASHGILELLPLVCMGWMIFTKEKNWHLVTIIISILWYSWILLQMEFATYTVILLFISVLLLSAKIRLPMPKAFVKILQNAAGLTLFVYLLHNPVVWFFRYSGWINTSQVIAIPLVIAISFSLAYVAKLLFDKMEGRLQRIFYKSKII